MVTRFSARPRKHESADEAPEEGWGVRPSSHRKALIIIAVGVLALGLVVASFALYYPYLEENYFGPAPTWHQFDSVFNGSGQLASESCSLRDLQPVLGGVGGVGKLTQTSVVICSFHGANYAGYFGFDCYATQAGPGVTVNGTTVPYEGCELSQAPFNHTFAGIFMLGAMMKESISVYGGGKIIANMTPTQSWRTFGCSMSSNNLTRTNGPLGCNFLGVEYVSADVSHVCYLQNPVVMYGESIPPGSCNLERSDL